MILFELKPETGREISQRTGSESKRFHSEGRKRQPARGSLSRMLELCNNVVKLISSRNGLLRGGKSNQRAGFFSRNIYLFSVHVLGPSGDSQNKPHRTSSNEKKHK